MENTSELNPSTGTASPAYEVPPIEIENPSSASQYTDKERPKRRLPDKCYSCRDSVGAVNLLGNFFLAFVKIYFGIIIGGSKGMFAEAIHGIANLGASVLMIWSVWFSRLPKSEKYQYGRGKSEFVVSGLIYGSLVTIGSYIIISNGIDMINKNYAEPKFYTIFGALVAVIAAEFTNEVLHGQGMCLSRRFNHASIKARATESKIDTYTSLSVLIGLIFAKFGFAVFDLVGAIVVGVIMIRTSWGKLIASVTSLLDVSLDIRYVKKIRYKLNKIKEIHHVGRLNARETGYRPEVEVTVYVDPALKVNSFTAIKNDVIGTIRSVLVYEGDVSVEIRATSEDML